MGVLSKHLPRSCHSVINNVDILKSFSYNLHMFYLRYVVPFSMEYYGQNPMLQDKIVCNQRLDGRLKGSFKARMNFLIVLGTLILKIPLGILEKAEFHSGVMPIFCGSGLGVDLTRIVLSRHKSWIGLTMKTLARAKVRAKHLRLVYA